MNYVNYNRRIDESIKQITFLYDEFQNKIIEFVINDKYITQNTIAEKLNVNVRTVKRNFKVLIDNNIIERVGSDKTGYWEVL